MKRKGFTLIELLAVIVVLAIIALIATPIVMNTIKKSKKGAAERSAEGYIRAVETTVATDRLNGNIIEEGEYEITSDGNLCRDKSASCSGDDKIIIDASGKKPSSGTVIIKGNEVQPGTILVMDDYTVGCEEYKCTASKVETYKITYKLTNVSGNNVTSITNNETKTLTFTANTGYSLPESVTVTGAAYTWNKEAGTLILSKVTGNVTVTINGKELKTYTNGEIIYFDVKNGVKCSESDYHVDNSKTGYNGISTTTTNQNGCLKFYAFNDTEGAKINLLLDHNTTAKVAWGNVSDGPIKVLAQLKIDTDEWKGTITPSNYTLDQTGQKSNAKYTIDYSGYKARLITAQEIATITEKTSWDEKTTNLILYFDSKNDGIESSTCKKGNTSGCSYGWLYDRTSTDCTTYGCLNNSDQTVNGYWTASLDASSSFYTYAWMIDSDAFMTNYNVALAYPGFRPVIEVMKSKLA